MSDKLTTQPAHGAGAADEPPEERRIGPYTLIRKLGKGAMGSVFLARKISDGKLLALKVLSPEMASDPEFIERFRREARAATKLAHPNIIRAFEVGEVDGLHFISMEYADSGDLESDLEKRPAGRFRSREVVKIAKDITQALMACHEQDIVHRDIKPANILLHSDGTYKLTDLGLAARRKDDVQVTKPGNAVGTPFYISPEQAQGESKVDITSDIYSLGATLYHLVSGRLPFEGENGVVVMTRHIVEPLTPPRMIQPRVPLALSRLIEKMMAKRPQDRHRSPNELWEDIKLIEHGGTPLLRRARTVAGGSGTEMREVFQSSPQIRTSKSKTGGKQTRHPGRRSLHPRHSRYPGTRKRKNNKSSAGTILFVGILLLAAAAIAGALAGFRPASVQNYFKKNATDEIKRQPKSKKPPKNKNSKP